MHSSITIHEDAQSARNEENTERVLRESYPVQTTAAFTRYAFDTHFKFTRVFLSAHFDLPEHMC